MLKEALTRRDFTEDALILSKAAMIVQNDMLGLKAFKFTGSFQQNLSGRFSTFKFKTTSIPHP